MPDLRKYFESQLVHAWQQQSNWLIIFRPLSWVYAIIVKINHYRLTRVKTPCTLSVPCVIVGNISVGGTGKTSVTAALAKRLIQQHYSVAVISKGYGRTSKLDQPVRVDSIAPAHYGDEPCLLFQQVHCPIIVCDDRLVALKAWQDKVDILLCDDGLQDYRFMHDYEIALIDSNRGFGSTRLLPEGFLREPITRLDTCNLVLQLGTSDALDYPHFDYRAVACRQLTSNITLSIEQAIQQWQGTTLEAYAGLGNNARFFTFLRELGFNCNEHPLPDHHAYQPKDFSQVTGNKIMTAKDAVKCQDFADTTFWYVEVVIDISNQIESKIIADLQEKIQCKRNGLTSLSAPSAKAS